MIQDNTRRAANATTIEERARLIAAAGGIDAALKAGHFQHPVTMTLAEAVVVGLLKQGVCTFLAIFGHGSTALAEALRIYERNGLVRCFQFRHETEMAHAATALRWIHGEACAVVTSIGPGALQAMAGSLVASSNGLGVYHIYGDETTHGEGYNMQQIPKPQQGLFGKLTALMGQSYVLHTPEALRDAMRRGRNAVFHPVKASPFFLLLPINTQPQMLEVRLSALPERVELPAMQAPPPEVIAAAVRLIAETKRVVIKAGGGTRGHAEALRAFAETAQVPVVLSPGSTGVLPDSHPLNMHVGGSKGSISGNFAMSEAELLIAIGTRAVCQSDCSGIGYPNVRRVININADMDDLLHYNNTHPLAGDITAVLEALTARLDRERPLGREDWLSHCAARKQAWLSFRARQCAAAPIHDEVWGKPVLTQPAAIATVAAFCKENGLLKIFDAGDVQANGFQIVEDDDPMDTVTESGASYMGFGVSAILANALARIPRYSVAFTGDGSFMMSPQILIDAVQHRARGMIVIFDNRRMAAISGLQDAQYNDDYRTSDEVEVDYVALASAVKGVFACHGGTTRTDLHRALDLAKSHDGLSVVHVPVYHGDDPKGGMGAYGRWNVGNWCDAVQRDYVNATI
ncbi:MAG: thiamine pyrophosphate-binding protein [Alphaproteobacteria bacterium]|nr:thiamine pyrophosphate-binding protein [Alphaproteobacteria bacterium]